MALTLRRKRWALRLATALLVAACAWQAARIVGVSPPSTPSAATLANRSAADSIAPAPRAPLEADDPVWAIPLRRPLYDPPPPPPPPVVKKELPPIRAKLMGTIIEPGASRAMIELPGGRVEFRGEGEPLGPQDEGAVISRIEQGSITVSRGEDQTQLKLANGS